jgi:serine/threonine-protein kinase
LSLRSIHRQVATFEARHVSLGQHVELRVLRPDLSSESAHHQFSRGARALGALHNTHVTKVCDAGVLESGQPYLVTELTDGQLLADWQRQQGRLSESDAAAFTLQLCTALSEAHRNGIVHRNLNPQAVLVTRHVGCPPRLRLDDFRLALLVDEPPPSTASIRGPSVAIYQAPEQLEQPNKVDARADIWSLGALLYEMVSGRPLMASPPALERAGIERAIDQLPYASDELQVVLRRCLEVDRRRRCATVEDLAAALNPIARARWSPLSPQPLRK